MKTRSDLEVSLVNRLVIGKNSNTVSASRITQEVQDAYLWATGLFWWTALTRARQSVALANTQLLNYDYYDYPTDFLDNTISRLYIDGKKYKRVAFQDLLDYADGSIELNDAPDKTKRYFGNNGRQYFVWPVYTGNTDPTVKNLVVWGQIQAVPLSAPNSQTIFSGMNESANEGIVKKAWSVLMRRPEPQLAAAEETGAVQLLAALFKKEVQALQTDQRLNHPMFDVPDMFGSLSGQTTIGNFNGVTVTT